MVIELRRWQRTIPFILDLIGWTQDNLGEPIYQLKDASLGYLELSKLAEALSDYADAPNEVRAYVDLLMDTEANA